MSMNYTPLPDEFFDEFDCLDNAQFGALIRGMMFYRIHGEEPVLQDPEKMFWKRVKNYTDRCVKSYNARCSVNAENGKRGGRPKKSNESEKTERFSDKPNENEKTERFSDKPNENEKSHTRNQKPETRNQKPETNDSSPLTPQGEKIRAFEKFWSGYPKKVGKQAAKKAFDRVNVPVETLLTAIERQKCSAQWSRDNGQFIPNPATWLNQGRWEDEVPPAGGTALRNTVFTHGDSEIQAIRHLQKLRDELARADEDDTGDRA